MELHIWNGGFTSVGVNPREVEAKGDSRIRNAWKSGCGKEKCMETAREKERQTEREGKREREMLLK